MHEGSYQQVTVVAATDLTTFEHRVIAVGGTLAVSATLAVGALKSTRADSGHHAGLAIAGHMKLIAGGAITAGNRIGVTSGGWVTATASGGFTIGKALVTAASGDLIACYANFGTVAVTGA